MANPLDRTWYNALVDDDGSGGVGTVWNKGQVNGLLNTIDAALVPMGQLLSVPYASSDFWCDGGSWTVPSNKVTYFYARIFNVALVQLWIEDSTANGAGPLHVRLPLMPSAASFASAIQMRLLSNGVWTGARAHVYSGVDNISIYHEDFSAFPSGSVAVQSFLMIPV